MKATKRDHRKRRNAALTPNFDERGISPGKSTRGTAVPFPQIERHLASLPALERAAEVLRFSAARLEHWLSPDGGLRTALRRGLFAWCLLVVAGLLVAPMITLLLGQIVHWTSLLGFVVHQLMVLPFGIAVFLLGVKGLAVLWRRLFGR